MNVGEVTKSRYDYSRRNFSVAKVDLGAANEERDGTCVVIRYVKHLDYSGELVEWGGFAGDRLYLATARDILERYDEDVLARVRALRKAEADRRQAQADRRQQIEEQRAADRAWLEGNLPAGHGIGLYRGEARVSYADLRRLVETLTGEGK